MDGTRSMGSRSSSRHGPTSTALFTGPVRRWKKAWAPIAPPAASSSSSTPSKIFLYKWVPLQTAGTKDEKSEEAVIQSARYVPVCLFSFEFNTAVNFGCLYGSRIVSSYLKANT
ncbi:hypothetical protein KP509_29G012400 [Ceratopteris richardii]|uniref:Uncharacterized protein n=1 Tax=Ceratopteris richardii TaxID=49495 RepID=A0A8T2R741_CERRI|nr:hypothetical protein KP509_29G012400 [Ceratopteris richardii]